jgi:fucose 4-O-acetylase-like acetyltransferase
MPLFFAISGFLAASALRRSTAALQVRARFRRLGVPLVVGMLTVVPLANFFVIEAAALWPRKGALPAKRELDLANVFSFTPRHLWFISYLLIISLLAIGIWLAIQRAPRIGAALNRGFGQMMKSWWAVPLLASISAAILITKTGWVAGERSPTPSFPPPLSSPISASSSSSAGCSVARAT